jgi:Polyketide cyclase / dehydrase and lipid transport
MTLGSARFHIRIKKPAATVWELAGDPTRLHEWFPGITSCEVEGTTRIITLGSGLPMPEEILVKDDDLRRFQYKITAAMFAFHRGSIDVIDLDDGTCLVVYTTEADPRTMAMTIGGATGGALDELQRLMELDTSGAA